MNTDLAKRMYLICGIFAFIIACVGLVVFVLIIPDQILYKSDLIRLTSLLLLDGITFFASIYSFVEYGIQRGIDYALDNK